MIRVLICDDHPVVRMGFAQLLSRAGDIELVGEAANYGELRQKLAEQACDVLVIDIEMPGRNGLEALVILRKEHPGLRAIVLSGHAENEYAVRALRAGASGYLSKASAPLQLVEAVRKAASGGKYISAEAAQALARTVAGEGRDAEHEALTDRELQVLRLIAAGKRLSEIAKALLLSPKTVSVYRARVLEKLGLANNVEIAHYAARHGLIEGGAQQGNAG
jgi:two-component system invasion response regulator UvrY